MMSSTTLKMVTLCKAAEDSQSNETPGYENYYMNMKKKQKQKQTKTAESTIYQG